MKNLQEINYDILVKELFPIIVILIKILLFLLLILFLVQKYTNIFNPLKNKIKNNNKITKILNFLQPLRKIKILIVANIIFIYRTYNWYNNENAIWFDFYSILTIYIITSILGIYIYKYGVKALIDNIPFLEQIKNKKMTSTLSEHELNMLYLRETVLPENIS